MFCYFLNGHLFEVKCQNEFFVIFLSVVSAAVQTQWRHEIGRGEGENNFCELRVICHCCLNRWWPQVVGFFSVSCWASLWSVPGSPRGSTHVGWAALVTTLQFQKTQTRTQTASNPVFKHCDFIIVIEKLKWASQVFLLWQGSGCLHFMFTLSPKSPDPDRILSAPTCHSLRQLRHLAHILRSSDTHSY